MCVLLPSGETRNYINIRKERSRLWDRSFLQVPFGLSQAPAFFQHLINKVLDNCPFAMTYLDDVIIFSDTEEEHLAHIKEIFKRLEACRPEDEKI